MLMTGDFKVSLVPDMELSPSYDLDVLCVGGHSPGLCYLKEAAALNPSYLLFLFPNNPPFPVPMMYPEQASL